MFTYDVYMILYAQMAEHINTTEGKETEEYSGNENDKLFEKG